MEYIEALALIMSSITSDTGLTNATSEESNAFHTALVAIIKSALEGSSEDATAFIIPNQDIWISQIIIMKKISLQFTNYPHMHSLIDAFQNQFSILLCQIVNENNAPSVADYKNYML